MNFFEVGKAIFRNKLLLFAFITGILCVIIIHIGLDLLLITAQNKFTEIQINEFYMIRTISYLFPVWLMYTYMWSLLSQSHLFIWLRKFDIRKFVFNFSLWTSIPMLIIFFYNSIFYYKNLIYISASVYTIGYAFLTIFATTFISKYNFKINGSVFSMSRGIVLTTLPTFLPILFYKKFFHWLPMVLNNKLTVELSFLIAGCSFLVFFLALAWLSPNLIVKLKYDIIKKLY